MGAHSTREPDRAASRYRLVAGPVCATSPQPVQPLLPPPPTRGAARLSPLLAFLCAGSVLAACDGPPPPDATLLASLEVPQAHQAGHALFERHCVVCHGPQALGTDQGPPLVHRVYRPLHHGDEAFQLAVAQGVRAHHWRYGDMPPVPGLTRDDVDAVTGYIRWLQRAAGIE